jgi:hypothetical protein
MLAANVWLIHLRRLSLVGVQLSTAASTVVCVAHAAGSNSQSELQSPAG